MYPVGFEVLPVHADIADVGRGEDDNLAGIGGIGEDFLVAGVRCIEDGFTEAWLTAGKGVSSELLSVLK